MAVCRKGSDAGKDACATMMLILAAAVCLLITVAGPAHWTLVQAGFRMVCHQIPERCLWIAGTAMPVCARCTGIYFGALAALSLRIRDRRQWLLAALALVAIDWSSEAAGLRPAWAALRLTTGLLLGLAAAPVVAAALSERTQWNRPPACSDRLKLRRL